MSILTKKRTTQDYEEKLVNFPKNTRENIQATINNFKKFVIEQYRSTPDQICGGISHYLSEITNESDIQKAMSLIEKVYKFKVN